MSETLKRRREAAKREKKFLVDQVIFLDDSDEEHSGKRYKQRNLFGDDVVEKKKSNKKRKKKEMAKKGSVVMQYEPGKCKDVLDRLRRKGSLVVAEENDNFTLSQNADPCEICTLSPKKGPDGYILVHMQHKETKANLHHIALRAAGKKLPEGNEDVSHLCHDRRCANPNHLVVESNVDNNRRKGCLSSRVKLKCCHCNSDLVVNLCKHTPPCCRPAR